MSDTDENSQRRFACDECRKRKLKCAGQLAGCTRCVNHNLTCHYSLQKPMGRPRKRQKVADDLGERRLPTTEWQDALSLKENVPNGVVQPGYTGLQTVDHNLLPGPIINPTNDSTSYAQSSAQTGSMLYEDYAPFGHSIEEVDSYLTPPCSSPTTPSPSAIADCFPTTLQWTDISNTPAFPVVATNPPSRKPSPSIRSAFNSSIPLASANYVRANRSTSPPSKVYPIPPTCTCLPNLYLTLSNLSSLSTELVSHATIDALQTATHTAHAVLYCSACPQKFLSGMQNVMLLGTLLTVIAEGWSRIVRVPAKDLALAFDTDPTTSRLSDAELSNSWTGAKELQWKLFAHYLVRHYVFGDIPPPDMHMPGMCLGLSASSSPNPGDRPFIVLNNLCDAMERRQKTWHGIIEATGEFPPQGNGAEALTGSETGSCSEEVRLMRIMEMENEKKEHLCLKIVASVRSVLAGVDRRPDRGERCGEQVRLNAALGR